MFADSGEALRYISQHDIAMVDLKVTGLAGQWLHITIPARQFTESIFTAGIGYDGSSGAGFARVESGDVAARPDAGTAFLDPFFEVPTLSFLCETVAADTKEPFANDPRVIAQRAVQRLRTIGLADEALMGPEYEFYVFESVAVVDTPYHASVSIRSGEVETEGASPAIASRHGYMRTPPTERLHDFRTEVTMALERAGVPVRYHHHEVGAPGQCEIEVALQPLVRAADQAMLIKYFVKNIARRHGKLATFMPKPVFGEAGNGMHVHQQLVRNEENLFYDLAGRNYADLSDLALHYIAGQLTHGRALTALCNPATNSFKRLVPGYEAPVNLFFSLANRSAAIRVPRYAVSADEKRIEYRPPDFAGNVYLTLAALLQAGVAGVERELDPAEHHLGPFDIDIARQDERFRRQITPLPTSLEEALRALEDDQAFLTRGEVFQEAFVPAWIAERREAGVRAVSTRPHPHEYHLYLDV